MPNAIPIIEKNNKFRVKWMDMPEIDTKDILNFEFLKDVNVLYEGRFDKQCQDKIITLYKYFENKTKDSNINPGDRCVISGDNNVVYMKGHIDGPCYYQKQKISLCIHASSHVSLNIDGKLFISSSGGYWHNADPKKIKPTKETIHKRFWTWGDHAGGSMGIYFYAPVKIWKYTHPDIY